MGFGQKLKRQNNKREKKVNTCVRSFAWMPNNKKNTQMIIIFNRMTIMLLLLLVVVMGCWWRKKKSLYTRTHRLCRFILLLEFRVYKNILVGMRKRNYACHKLDWFIILWWWWWCWWWAKLSVRSNFKWHILQTDSVQLFNKMLLHYVFCGVRFFVFINWRSWFTRTFISIWIAQKCIFTIRSHLSIEYVWSLCFACISHGMLLHHPVSALPTEWKNNIFVIVSTSSMNAFGIDYNIFYYKSDSEIEFSFE